MRATQAMIGLAVFGALVFRPGTARPTEAWEQNLRESRGDATEQWASRTVWSCDRRKMVVVEGVRANEKIPPQRANLVASVLMDLMRYCTEEITAKVGLDQKITVAVNGRVYEN